MEVKTVGETSFSLRSVARYGLIVLLLAAVLFVPTLFVDGYAKALNTLILVALLGLVGRTILSSFLSFSKVRPPDIEDGADLPTVSVVIPAYNEAPVLPGTIEACKRVDYPAEKLEVILCYEADSVDSTAEIAERAAANDDRFVALERDEPGGGKAKAVNYALRRASGDVIASIDADHQFKPDAVRRAVAWFRSDEDLWCIKGRCYGDNPTDSLIALHATVERHIAEKADIFARQVLGSFTFFGGGQAFFRREAFEELGLFDEEILVEDIDMSMRIHEVGKKLRVDPRILTYEENPATAAGWWNQRKRWARGWMQVTERYLLGLPGQSALSTRTKVDAAYTLAYAVIPVLFVFSLPIPLVEVVTNVSLGTYLPDVLWTVVSAAPVLVASLVFLQDRMEGERHHPAEYLAAFTLWFYLIFQSVVFVTAFIDEFILRTPSVYVTTSRTGGHTSAAAQDSFDSSD